MVRNVGDWTSFAKTKSCLLLPKSAWSRISKRQYPRPLTLVCGLYGDQAGRIWLGFENGEVAVSAGGASRLSSTGTGFLQRLCW